MALNIKFDSDQAAEDGIAAGPFTTVMLTAEVTKINAVPAPGDGVTLKNANQNIIGDEFIVINDSTIVGPGGPLVIYPVAADTINGAAGPFAAAAIFPAPGATITLKCIGLGQWWIISIV